MVDGDCYRLQSLIYHRFWQTTSSPARSVTCWRWAGAGIQRLATWRITSSRGSQARTDILPAVNSIYAAHDMTQAANYLRRGLAAALACARYGLVPASKGRFPAAGRPAETNPGGEVWVDLDHRHSRPAGSAFRFQVPLRPGRWPGRRAGLCAPSHSVSPAATRWVW
jgi:hypothetical protein